VYEARAADHAGARGGLDQNTSFDSAIRGDDTRPAYGASKCGLNTLTLCIATRYGKRGIRCNAVMPGQVLRSGPVSATVHAHRAKMLRSTLTPELGQPEDIAAVVVFLASDESRYVTSQLMSVDGGLACHLPQYVGSSKS
jgi:NAD(P)-dependent dehydrogenase (short-subunit alcohol dehydrogenase family)